MEVGARLSTLYWPMTKVHGSVDLRRVVGGMTGDGVVRILGAVSGRIK